MDSTCEIYFYGLFQDIRQPFERPRLTVRHKPAANSVSQAYHKPLDFRVETGILPHKSNAKLRKTAALYAIALLQRVQRAMS